MFRKSLISNHLMTKSHIHTEGRVTCAVHRLVKIIYQSACNWLPWGNTTYHDINAECDFKPNVIKKKKKNVHVNIWTNWIIHTWLVMLRQRPTVENTTKQTEFCVLNMSLNLFSFNQYLQVICSFNLTCTLQQSMQRHHYIQTSCLCDSAWSCHHMYSYNMLTYTIYISPWTKSCVTALCTWSKTTTELHWEWWVTWCS